MELSFIISALKRYSLIILVCAGLGVGLAVFYAQATNELLYSSSAGFEVEQPTGVGTNPFADKDRYVAGQVAIMNSSTIRKTALEAINSSIEDGGEITLVELGESITITQRPETSIVIIESQHQNRELAILIAQKYAEAYEDSLSVVDKNIQSRIAAEDVRLAALEEELAEVNARIARSIRADDSSLEVANPAEASNRDDLQSQIAAVRNAQEELRTRSIREIQTVLFETPTDAVAKTTKSPATLFVAGLFGGAIIGLIIALGLARFSSKVLDEVSVGELLGTPLVLELRHYRSLSHEPAAAFKALPISAVPTIDQLCVRAEAKAQTSQLVVAVVGTQRGSGGTTLAMAMAQRFAANGSSVILVDGDVRDPYISSAFGATAGGIPAVIANDGALADRDGRSFLTRTSNPRVAVLGLGGSKAASAFRRDTVAKVIEAARRKGQVIIIDGGPALESAATIQVLRLADAAVLATPTSRQKTGDLADIGRQLAPMRDKLIPVSTLPSKATKTDLGEGTLYQAEAEEELVYD